MAISALTYSANVTLKKALDQSCLRFRQLLSRMAPTLKHLKQATPRILRSERLYYARHFGHGPLNRLNPPLSVFPPIAHECALVLRLP